jgi:hypothetical protein
MLHVDKLHPYYGGMHTSTFVVSRLALRWAAKRPQ